MYWRNLGLQVGAVSRSHLGYQRWPDDHVGGRWGLRTYRDSKYCIEPLGRADDVREADGEAVLSFEQATAKAREPLGDSPKKRVSVEEPSTASGPD
jgi:hypothetical protein